ncbi:MULTISPECIES: ADP-ribosyl-[dinitrogen reductase] hydrolase [Thiorhodovibrio]|uniref:ADP-ribosyl-[dinitrogen reductase] hydrolase n=1 Tax=Thiorhodovibrio TaxID=61593 RepID=UPI001914504E|nr:MULTISPECIES: ADP-ribosyl-[dinitrogen reductase] hydrolase [Thiorhodovibrio]MBK5967864.1 ADP-ribosyl-[dinitrogen reductase] hydrolase [Thiorhodovibrio winogradskyi]WPL14089.1 ADP-ribosyl-[dinitrogen reductase] glycohydrolase [Thiorhodovibrio litoralis]
MLVSVLDPEALFLAKADSGELIRRRAVGAYLGLAVGDALGATVEFMMPREIQAEYRVHQEMIGGGWLKLRKGQVTDDTEMALALGRSIVQAGRVDATAAAEAFSDWMSTKPVDIGNTVRRGIAHFRQTGETEMPENDYDAGNGACMRCLPIALATLGADIEAVDQANRIQAHVTHHHILSDAGTLCVIRMVQAAILGGDKTGLKLLAESLVAQERRFGFERKRLENPSAYIVDTLKVVFQALFATDSFESALIEAVNRGGDADTTGAIVGMIAGALHGPAAIPVRWSRHLKRPVKQEAVSQAHALLALSPFVRSGQVR